MVHALETIHSAPAMAADALFHALPRKERERLLTLVPVLEKLDRAPVLNVALREAATALGHVRGFAESTLEKSLIKWRATGRDWHEMVDRARVPALNRNHKAAANRPEFVEHVKKLAENNQRNSKPAFRALWRAWCAGERIPGYGTWREWHAAEFPGAALPASVPRPRGWHWRTLYRLLPSERALKAARRGFLAALPEGATVARTGRNLRALELLVCDDFRLDVMAYISRQMMTPDGRILKPGVYYVAGLMLMDVGSRKIIGWCLKLQAKDQAGTRLVIGRDDLAALFGQALREHGLPRDYAITVLTENATAAFSKEAASVLQFRFGEKIRIETTGLIDNKLLPAGWREGGGKYWHKGWIESTFNLLHNELAALPGQAGSSYARAPGKLGGELQYAENMLKAAARKDDRTAARLKMPLMNFEQVTAAFANAVDFALNARTDHTIEDLDEVIEWRRDAADAWHPENELALLAPEEALGIEFPPVPRREAPTERMEKLMRRTTLDPVPASATAPLLSSPRPVTVSGGLISWADKGERFVFFSELPEAADILSDGRKYTAHWSRGEPEFVYLYREDTGAFVGVLPRFEKVDALDKDALSAAGAKTARVNNRLVAEYRERHADENAELVAMREHNARLLAPAKRIHETDTSETPPVPTATRPRRSRFGAEALV